MLAEEEDLSQNTTLHPDGIYDLIACGYGDLLVVDIRQVEDFRGCHLRGAIHFAFQVEQAETKRHKAIRFYKEMQRLERTWFTRVLVVTDVDDPVGEGDGSGDAVDAMPLSPASPSRAQQKQKQSKGLEFAEVIKSAPGMKHVTSVWIIDGGFVRFAEKYPYMCVSSINAKREEASFRDATRQLQEYYANMPHDEKVPILASLALPSPFEFPEPNPPSSSASSSFTSSSSSCTATTSTSTSSSTTPHDDTSADDGQDHTEASASSNGAATTTPVTPAKRPLRSLPWAAKYVKCSPGKWPSRLVEGFLYLGDYETACDPLALRALHIGRIVNCTPDRINLWERRPPRKRPRLDAEEGADPTQPPSSSASSHPINTCPASSSTPPSSLSSSPPPDEHPGGDDGEALEEPLARVLFPDVKIESHLRIAVLDNYSDDLAQYFEQAINFIEQARHGSTPHAVLVHCAQGISRSVTIAIAYMMKVHGMSLREAHDLVRSKRPVSKPNVGFLKQLAAYELRLRGTVSMET